MAKLGLLFIITLTFLVSLSTSNLFGSICDDRLDIPCDYLYDLREALSDDFLDSFLSLTDDNAYNSTLNDTAIFALASLIYQQSSLFDSLKIWLLGPEGEVIIASDKLIVFGDTIEWCLSKELFACLKPICCQSVVLQAYFCDNEGWDVVESNGALIAKYARRIVGPSSINYVLLATQPISP
eukprot:TRINITY_DN920_c0_g1_i1.p1 TRINITY_DN920_c0_g1~~TRINITY_DN920_c0_g1_i1.p1  ORF type:complete len:182 (-),score=36.85 TRINITY_DN920_c0_g1_i1:64-609(-)